jgi:enoyl-CoA hydratase/carnithine racemase
LSLKELTYEQRGRCAWLTMNRPEARNALSKEMFRDLAKSLSKAIRNKSIRFIAITGAGDSFSAGLDIKQVGGFSSRSEAKNFVYKLVKPFWKLLLDCDKPVLAVVDGPAYGAGAEIVLASDIVVASSRSKFAFSGGRVGALCCISGVIGAMVMEGRKVVEMNLTGNPLTADEAKQAGLVTYVAPREGVTSVANQVLEDLERVSPISNSSFKRIRRGTIPKQALDQAYRQLFRTITSPDFSKGSNAFLHKQVPNF